jgi:aconitate hydratase
VSILGVTSLSQGQPLEVVVKHQNGGEDRFPVNHTLNDEQIAWFKAGSALNLLRQGH